MADTTDITSLPDKLTRAVRWYLVQQGMDPAQVFHHFDFRDRKYVTTEGGVAKRIIDVLNKPVGPEVIFTGDEEFIVEIQVHATLQAGLTAVQAEKLRYDLAADVGTVRAALMKSNDQGQNLFVTRNAINAAAYTMSTPPANPTPDQIAIAGYNVDMNDFTLTKWVNDVYGVSSTTQTTVTVTMRFRCAAVETKLDGYATDLTQ